MQQIRELATTMQDELAQQNSGAEKTSLVSQTSLPDATGSALLRMMAQTSDRFPNQKISEGTQEMYLVEWEEMTTKYGLEVFRQGLSKAIREQEFFPSPKLIRDHCASIRNAQREAAESQRYFRELDEWKAQKARQEAEDAGKPKPEPTETEVRLNRMLEVARAQANARGLGSRSRSVEEHLAGSGEDSLCAEAVL